LGSRKGAFWKAKSSILKKTYLSSSLSENKEKITDIYTEQMQVEEVFDIFNKHNTVNRLTSNWAEASEKLRERCSYFSIYDDLQNYNVFVNTNKRLLSYDIDTAKEGPVINRTQDIPNWVYLYEDFERLVQVRYEIKDSGFYLFFATNCKESSTDISLTYKALNPGKEHLSVDLIPNKLTYLIFFITWIIVSAISCLMISYRIFKKQSLSYLSILILCSYFMITCYLILRYVYWALISWLGKVSIYFEGSLILLEVLIMLVYLIIINLVANGYKIVTDSFSWGRFTKNLVIMLLIVFTSFFVQFQNLFLMIFLVAEVIVMVIFLYVDIKSWISKLTQINEELNPIFVEEREARDSNDFKIKYYKSFIIYLIIYFSMEETVLCLRPFLAPYHEWIFALVQQIINLVSMTFLFVTLTYSIEFIKFEGIQDGARVAPNPYFKNRILKICGEIIAIKSVDEHGNFSINLGIESNQGIMLKNSGKNYISERARVYQTAFNRASLWIDNSVSLMHSNRNFAWDAGEKHNIWSMIQNIHEEDKEERKIRNDLTDPEKGENIEKVALTEYLDLDSNLFESQDVRDFRNCRAPKIAKPSWSKKEGSFPWMNLKQKSVLRRQSISCARSQDTESNKRSHHQEHHFSNDEES